MAVKELEHSTTKKIRLKKRYAEPEEPQIVNPTFGRGKTLGHADTYRPTAEVIEEDISVSHSSNDLSNEDEFPVQRRRGQFTMYVDEKKSKLQIQEE